MPSSIYKVPRDAKRAIGYSILPHIVGVVIKVSCYSFFSKCESCDELSLDCRPSLQCGFSLLIWGTAGEDSAEQQLEFQASSTICMLL